MLKVAADEEDISQAVARKTIERKDNRYLEIRKTAKYRMQLLSLTH